MTPRPARFSRTNAHVLLSGSTFTAEISDPGWVQGRLRRLLSLLTFAMEARFCYAGAFLADFSYLSRLILVPLTADDIPTGSKPWRASASAREPKGPGRSFLPLDQPAPFFRPRTLYADSSRWILAFSARLFSNLNCRDPCRLTT